MVEAPCPQSHINYIITVFDAPNERLNKSTVPLGSNTLCRQGASITWNRRKPKEEKGGEGFTELINDLSYKQKELNTSIRSLRKTGGEFAEAERDYKIKLRQEALKLRDEGMAIGMIDKVIYGVPSVAELRFRRDVAEAVYKANQESINVIKLQMRIIENQIGREWGETK